MATQAIGPASHEATKRPASSSPGHAGPKRQQTTASSPAPTPSKPIKALEKHSPKDILADADAADPAATTTWRTDFSEHIILPFDLRSDPKALYDPDNRAMIQSIFPGSCGVSSDTYFFYLYYPKEQAPPKPWPKTLAGLPLHITLGNGWEYTPMPRLRPVPRRNGIIAPALDGRHLKDWSLVFKTVKDHFSNLGISLTEVMYWKTHLTLVLEHQSTETARLPHRVGNLQCFYFFEQEVGRPARPQARRARDPAPGEPDDTAYSILRPGLRLASGYLHGKTGGQYLNTTSGVLVKDAAGDVFMTAASHGFPESAGRDVFHPGPTGRRIGTIVKVVDQTDIALVKLEDGETFVNEVFTNSEIPTPINLTFLKSRSLCENADSVVMDAPETAPETGCIFGSLVHESFQRVPADDETVPEQDWVYTIWLYGGEGIASDLPDGIYGSAIWEEAGGVLGFFRYAPKDGEFSPGWCAGSGADVLISRRYTLVDTSSQVPVNS